MVDEDVILDALAEAVYEWDMVRAGKTRFSRYSDIGKAQQESYLAIAAVAFKIMDTYLDDEYLEDDSDNDLLDDWDF